MSAESSVRDDVHSGENVSDEDSPPTHSVMRSLGIRRKPHKKKPMKKIMTRISERTNEGESVNYDEDPGASTSVMATRQIETVPEASST